MFNKIPTSIRLLDYKKFRSELKLILVQNVFYSIPLGVHNDSFIKCPEEAFDWSSRRFLMLQEIVQHNPDVICLQEVDHFRFLQAALKSIGYEGSFLPKPDSPCVYLNENNGPDGCALFYKTSRFEQLAVDCRVLEVWQVQSNQVGLCASLLDKETNQEVCVATTHLKAKSGALLATLRDQQGKDLLDWLYSISKGRPVILSGDFNAEPSEPVYKTTKHHRLNLRSAYSAAGQEPAYTTWKVREEGEVCHTIDYIFHSSCLSPTQLLDLPDESSLGIGRAPSMHYPSDHFSLVTDLLCSGN